MNFEHPTPHSEPKANELLEQEAAKKASATTEKPAWARDVKIGINREDVLASVQDPEVRAKLEAEYAKKPTPEQEAARLERERVAQMARESAAADEEERLRLQSKLAKANPDMRTRFDLKAVGETPQAGETRKSFWDRLLGR